MSERPLSFLHLGGGNSSLTAGEPHVLKCICLLSWASTHDTFPGWKRRRRKGRQPWLSSARKMALQNKGAFVRARSAQGQAGLRPPSCPQASLGAHRRSPSPRRLIHLVHTQRGYFKQNTSNFLFLKLSCISKSILSHLVETDSAPSVGVNGVTLRGICSRAWGFLSSCPWGWLTSICHQYLCY